ncbi:MAG: polysaccharide biosynthesis/export family protein [Acidobacteriia bacterium]|nr:polysaccharide biosynthesis/export family protein [Terriglobia bacterium]
MNEFATTAFLRLLPGRLLPGRTGVVCLLSGMLCLAAPGQVQQGGKQAADTAEKKRIANEPVPIAPPGIGTAAPVDPKSYKIGSEDVLRIQVWKEPELGGLMTVRPDGIITVDLVGEIQASGLTPDQLTQKLKEEYAKLINNPIVIVSVHQVRSKKYYLSGGLMRNGEVPLVVPTTVMEALSIAGGFTEFANKKKVVILRGDKRYFFNYNEVAKGKKLEQNIYLENGDFIIVN